MIKSVFVENFMRIHERTEVPLGPVTVLVGANGSGKSSILKAIHWAVRCATLRDAKDKTTLDRMDYTPSKDFLELAHKRRIQNSENMPKIIVGFVDNSDRETIIKINAARNDAGAKAIISGPMTTILTKSEPQTAYIPGLAGLAETETLLSTPVLHRKAASGEGGSVLRHVLLDLADGSTAENYAELHELNKWVSKIIPGVRFWVKFDKLRDVHISAHFLTDDMKVTGRTIDLQRKPLEMAGTGFLQIVQIFAYLLKFKPRLLLIDEPDAHLHPGTQEALIHTLEEAAAEYPDTQFILTTHSPSLVRACGSSTRVHWVNHGKVKSDDEEVVRARMGWGALDKEIILFSEDTKLEMIKSILNQWPSLSRKVLVWPTFGNTLLPHGESLKKLRDNLKIGVLVHRDRDFMSDTDVAEWREKKGYTQHDIPVWVTPGSDVESCFCTSEHIANVLDIDSEDAKEILRNAISSLNQVEVERDFNNAISSAVSILSGDSRSVPTVRWRELGGFCHNTIKGKTLIEAISECIREKYKGTPDSRKLSRVQHLKKAQSPIQVALCLKAVVEEATRKHSDISRGSVGTSSPAMSQTNQNGNNASGAPSAATALAGA